MKNNFVSFLLISATLVFTSQVNASNVYQDDEIDTKVVTEHQTTVKGKSFSYIATTGTQPL
ncbi:MAG: carboxypeptidase, partial [Gammaproteobacteria bacterium]|nr:carboxypeptidase [Gammaproteobacteria bacterium]